MGNWISIDLANSQPFFLSQVLNILINSHQSHYNTHNYTPHTPTTINNNIPLCSDFFKIYLGKCFAKQVVKMISKITQNNQSSITEELLNLQISCINGTFYEDFIGRFDGDTLTRDDVKELLFAVLFSRNVIYREHNRKVPYEAEKKKFAQVYPNISRIIEAMKHYDHTKLTILLQRIESTIFIDTICPLLVAQGIVPITIHDSFIVQAEQAERALEVCKHIFREIFQVIPTFHVEPLKDVHSDSDEENDIPRTQEQPVFIHRLAG